MQRLTRQPINLLLAAALAIVAVTVWTPVRAHARQGSPTRATYTIPSFGIRSGEEIVVSLVNPNAFPPGPCRVRVVDSSGNPVADTGLFGLPGDATMHFRFTHSQLTGPGALARGRAQFRVVVDVFADPNDPNGVPPGPCVPGVELVNSSTGHTFAILPPPCVPTFTFALNG